MLMARFGEPVGPSTDDLRWTAAARQALAAGRSQAAPDRDVLQGCLKGKFDNPILGIHGGHLLALQPKPDLALLREVYGNLSGMLGPHPDVEALLIPLRDDRAAQLAFPEPPMLRASWAHLCQASVPGKDPRPDGSYSARIAASLWGSGVWLAWRMPPPVTAAAGSPSGRSLQELVTLANAGKLQQTALASLAQDGQLTPTESLIANSLFAADQRLKLTHELAKQKETHGSSSLWDYVIPIGWLILNSLIVPAIIRQTEKLIAEDLKAESLSKGTGVPLNTILSAASLLASKLRTKLTTQTDSELEAGCLTSCYARRHLNTTADPAIPKATASSYLRPHATGRAPRAS